MHRLFLSPVRSLSSIVYRLFANEAGFIVIDKSAGVSFHSENKQQGLVEYLRHDLAIPLWPVHRLDKGTSGLLLLAKSQRACRDLSALFATKAIQKYYLALIHFKPHQ